MSTLRLTGSMLAALLALNCSETSPADSPAEHQSLGTMLVENTGARCTPENTWTLQAERTLGETGEVSPFGEVTSVAQTPSGEILVLDGMTKRVLIFGADGIFRRQFGRSGDGPGEFHRPRYVGALRDGRIAVGDASPSRLYVLTGDGDLLSQIRVEAPADPSIANIVADWNVSPSGVVWAALRIYVTTPGDSVPVKFVRFDQSGQVQDTVMSWLLPGDKHRYEIWKSRWQWATGPDGLVATSPGHSHEIRILRPDRDTVIATRDVDPVTVTPRLRTKFLDLFFASMERGGESSEMVRQARQLAQVPSQFSAIDGLLIATPSGRIWAKSVDPEADETSSTLVVHHIYSPNGEYLGCAASPARFQLLFLTDSLAWGRWRNELDVPFARSYRITPPSQ